MLNQQLPKNAQTEKNLKAILHGKREQKKKYSNAVLYESQMQK